MHKRHAQKHGPQSHTCLLCAPPVTSHTRTHSPPHSHTYLPPPPGHTHTPRADGHSSQVTRARSRPPRPRMQTGTLPSRRLPAPGSAAAVAATPLRLSPQNRPDSLTSGFQVLVGSGRVLPAQGPLGNVVQTGVAAAF